MRYKASQFNYLRENKDGIVLYNTLYNTLVRLNREEYDQYLFKAEVDPDLCNEFVENGIWVENDLNEMERYLACCEAYTLYMPRPLGITVTTTLKCNARCVYCYEKGVKSKDIFPDAEDKIIDFIKANGIQDEVQLIWFGGEPLMNTDFMDSLSKRLQTECIAFTSYIITNGSLLTERMVREQFPLWHVKDMQITLDGTKAQYERRKRYVVPEEGEFYKILNAIRTVAQEDVFINIRLNIDRENKDDIIDVLRELDAVFSGYTNIVFYPAFITGSSEPMDENEKVQCVKEMLMAMKNISKLTAGTKFYSLPRMHACMNGDPRSFSIDVDGNIFACEHYVGRSEMAIGNIAEGVLKKDTRGYGVVFRDECRECVFLPKCYGGCEANNQEGDDPCMIEKYLIKAYLELL